MGQCGKKWWSGATLGDKMFLGEFDYKLDEKGRVSLPAKFRAKLKDGVVLAPGLENYISVYSVAQWKQFSEKINSSLMSPSKLRSLNRALFATAFYIPIDKAGRISLPAPLRERAAIGDDVVIAGVNDHIELWNKEQWLAEKNASLTQAWQIIEGMDR